jgi:hypothetical protein
MKLVITHSDTIRNIVDIYFSLFGDNKHLHNVTKIIFSNDCECWFYENDKYVGLYGIPDLVESYINNKINE